MKEDFFKRKEPKAPELPNHKDYDLSKSDNDLESCGIEDTSGLKLRFDQMLDTIGDSLDRATKEVKSNPDAHVDNLVGVTCQIVERTLTKRELSFLMSKSILSDLIEKAKKSNN